MTHPVSMRRAYVALGVCADPVLQQGVGSGGASNAPGPSRRYRANPPKLLFNKLLT